MKESRNKYKSIPGWGIDSYLLEGNESLLDEQKFRKCVDTAWARPVGQSQKIEILKSIERRDLPAVFGETLPPKGLSGRLRRLAFQQSESRLRHWFGLMLADRIEQMGTLMEEIGHGNLPNLAKERGWRVLWKYDSKAVIRRIALFSAAASLATYFVMKNKKK